MVIHRTAEGMEPAKKYGVRVHVIPFLPAKRAMHLGDLYEEDERLWTKVRREVTPEGSLHLVVERSREYSGSKLEIFIDPVSGAAPHARVAVENHTDTSPFNGRWTDITGGIWLNRADWNGTSAFVLQWNLYGLAGARTCDHGMVELEP